MPTYQYACSKCDAEQDEYRSVARRNDPVVCKCGSKMKKILSPYTAISDLTPYFDDNLQTKIESRKHRARVMKEQGVYEYYGKGWQ